MSDPGDREPYHHGDLRAALCRHALRTIETAGAGALSLRDAARSLGVSPSAVYRHFEDKAALLCAVVDDGLTRMTRSMEAAARGAEERATHGNEARAALVALSAAYVRFAAAHPTHFRAIVEHAPVATHAEGAHPEPRDLLAAAVDRALAGASKEEKRGARRTAVAAIHGLSVLVASSPSDTADPASHDAAARDAIELVLRGAQRSASSPSSSGVSANERSAPRPAPSSPGSSPASAASSRRPKPGST